MTTKNGEIVDKEIYGNDTDGNKLYFVMWERIANSGYYLLWAKNEKEAMAKIGFNLEFVLFTVVEISRKSLPVQFGKRN